MRRPGVGTGRRIGFRGIGGAPADPGLDLAAGTYTCASETFRQTGPSAGEWLAANQIRLVRYLEADDEMIHIEGARTQLLAAPADITAGSWTAGSSSTPTANAATAPDGTATADQEDTEIGGQGNLYSLGNLTGRYSASAFARMVSGSGSLNYALRSGADGTGAYETASLTEEWSRIRATFLGVGGASYWVPSEGRTIGTLTEQAQNTYSVWHQVEAGAFASSPIRTASGTRASCNLTVPNGAYPASVLTRGFRVSVAPDCSSAEFVNMGGGMSIVWTGSTDLVWLMVSGGTVIAQVWDNGAAIVASGALTWNRFDKLTITANAIAGTLTISGSATGNGTFGSTPWSWTSGQPLYVGKSSINTAYLFGRISRYMELL